LDVTRNSLGRLAVSIATEFNAQHRMGQDLNGAQGGDFFQVASPVSIPSNANTSSANIAASFSDVSALSTSDYRVQYLAGVGPAPNYYRVTRISDGASHSPEVLPFTIDGVTLNLALDNGAPPSPIQPNVNDEFLVRPTALAASSISVLVSDTSKLAAAVAVTATTPSTNLGTGKISSGAIDSLVISRSNSANARISDVTVGDSFKANTLASPLNLTFAAPSSLSGFPIGALVSVTAPGGAISNYQVAAANLPTANPPQVVNIPYASGAQIAYGGNPGPPVAGETFTLAKTTPITPTQLTYNTGNNFTGFPAGANVTVKNGNSSTTYPAGTAVPYIEGSTISFSGLSFTVSGNYRIGDVVNIAANPTGTGDNRNAANLAGLQARNTMISGTTSFQGAYGQFVSLVGNKSRELEITSAAETNLLNQALTAQQSESGVNLDEEAANLLRYQQAYQAAGKLMQIASQLFDIILSVGR
jgi:flagellar hook-associated protein 1 FlgK